MDVEGPLSPDRNSCMVGTTVAGVGPTLVGSEPTTMCMVEKGPLGLGPFGPVEGTPVMMGGMDTIPLLTVPT